MLESGAMLGDRYRVGRRLGKGGMGIVVEALHVQLGTHVAIKILKKEADPASVERFLREARAAAQLRGEHICRVYDFGTLPDGTPYMVMELLRGSDLATMRAAAGSVAPARLARYMLEVCAAMAEAHARGIIHRDLKPSNLFVIERPDGVSSIKVLDFGIAKSITKQDFSLTETANVMGSPAYMSPEQLKSSKNVDARSDIWSLGVVMYELLCGRHPFKGETLTALAISIANDAPPPVPESVPAAFAAIVYRCMEKDPSKRYPDVGALAAALEPLASSDASIAGAIARVLTGAAAVEVDGNETSPALPSNLSLRGTGSSASLPPAADVTSALETDKPFDGKITTFSVASGVIEAQTGERARTGKRLAVSIFGAATLAAVIVVVAAFKLGGSTHRTTGSAPAASSPTPPAPVLAPASTVIARDAGVAEETTSVDAGVAESTATVDAAVAKSAVETTATAPAHKPKVKPKTKTRTPPTDLTRSRY